eukprot:SAG31_NODE_50_length_30520_cov_89.906712_23_plen_105_part_00
MRLAGECPGSILICIAFQCLDKDCKVSDAAAIPAPAPASQAQKLDQKIDADIGSRMEQKPRKAVLHELLTQHQKVQEQTAGTKLKLEDDMESWLDVVVYRGKYR